MKILINEKQKQKIIEDSINDELNSILIDINSLNKNIIKSLKETYVLNINPSVEYDNNLGGFLFPLFEYIKINLKNISESDIYSILSYFVVRYSDKKNIDSIVSEIKKKNLNKILNKIIKKLNKLKITFFKFIKSIGIDDKNPEKLMRYSFIIPFLPKLYKISKNKNINKKEFYEIIKNFNVGDSLFLTQNELESFLKKIYIRFQSNL